MIVAISIMIKILILLVIHPFKMRHSSTNIVVNNTNSMFTGIILKIYPVKYKFNLLINMPNLVYYNTPIYIYQF